MLAAASASHLAHVERPLHTGATRYSTHPDPHLPSAAQQVLCTSVMWTAGCRHRRGCPTSSYTTSGTNQRDVQGGEASRPQHTASVIGLRDMPRRDVPLEGETQHCVTRSFPVASTCQSEVHRCDTRKMDTDQLTGGKWLTQWRCGPGTDGRSVTAPHRTVPG